MENHKPSEIATEHDTEQTSDSKKNSRALAHDTIDARWEDHLTKFFNDLSSTLKLTKMSLDTPEESKRTLEVLSKMKEQITNHRQTARALREFIITEAAHNPHAFSSSKGYHPPKIIH